MHSKNKKPMTKAEREHVDRVKAMPCALCHTPGPSEAHEIGQGAWLTSIPLCPDCHRGAHNGLHGRRALWLVKKATELSLLGETISLMLYGRTA